MPSIIPYIVYIHYTAMIIMAYNIWYIYIRTKKEEEKIYTSYLLVLIYLILDIEYMIGWYIYLKSISLDIVYIS